MIKLRIQGSLGEVQKFLESLKDHYHVLEHSEPYANRNSECVRVYVEIRQDDK
ncbi:DUF3970 family protein [Hazenella coriacea]|uniref:DUF3970 family protein n=1 Tax=Hazenella coriacea TaxID=1179467 RepID=UPI0010535B86